MLILSAINLMAQNTIITFRKHMKKKILFVVTSHKKAGNSGNVTGHYVSEVSHPWKVLIDAGYDIDFASPKGGKAPVDGFDLEDFTNKHYAGGHGTMWDFPGNSGLAEIVRKIYEAGGIVSAVCHGPSA